MDKNLVRFGLAAIIILVIFAVVELYPPSEKLKPGIDLAGGTSLIYEIDTTGLDEREIDGLSQRLAPILLKRIDPGNIQNIIMRPLGDTRIEIQVPLASADTLRKRQAYDQAMEAISQDNINLALIKRTLTKEPNERARIFAEFAADSNERKEILQQLASTYDARKAAQEKRDSLKTQLDTITEKLEKTDVDMNSLAGIAPNWQQMDPNQQKNTIEQLLGDAKKTDNQTKQIEQYFQIYQQWAQVVNDLTRPETGLNAAYRQAEIGLKDFNISIETLKEVLEMPAKSIKRNEMLQRFKDSFPSRATQIDNLVKVFEQYRPVRGRIDGPEDVKRMLKGAGVLEFRILPKLDDGRTNKDEIQTYLDALKTKGPKLASDSKYVWIQIEDIENGTWRQSERNQIIIGTFADKYYVLASNQKGEVLLRHSGKKPWKLQKAGATVDELGKRAISFSFDEVGASLFYDVTRNNLQRPLCIILDNLAITAPNIRSAIRASGVIEGDFTMNEQLDMINKLNAGSLPARLIEPPVSEKTIGAVIGADNRDQGIRAGIIALSVVCGFLLVYYMLAGFIADIAIVLNILFVLAIMALSRATFTLPGIAGLILTVGMSDDANILIYERIREELLGGASLRNAIDNGYRRAFWTIFDSNITTIITAVILYMVGSEEIKGFAITLILGLVSSMFTGLFVTRIIFHLLLSKGFIRDRLSMFQIFRQKININWMGLRPVMFTISILLVGAGLFVFYTRDNTKNNKYDIEFTGGTSVQIDLKPDSSLDRAEVEKIITDEGKRLSNPAIAAARVYSVGDRQSKRQYEITTTETNKATTEIVFKAGSQESVKSVTDAIENVQEKSRGKITNMVVNQDPANPAKFTISTSQLNKSVVSSILHSAFDDKADISEPVVNEIVTAAVLDAFKGKLQIMESLNPKIISTTPIDEKAIDKTPELSDFLGGVRIEFSVEKPATLDEMNQRLRDLRFKPDMQQIVWHNYQLFDNKLNAQNKEPLNDFIYVSAEPEAGFRQISEDERTNFVNNETAKIIAAGQMQSSLSRITQFAPSIGSEAKTRAVIAAVLSLIAMAGYLWIRFGNLRYGIGAIISLTHDVCIVLGAVAACAYITNTRIGQILLIGDFKIDLAMIAAFLTLVGYSVNDTIVVYDRIRENRRRLSTITPQLINNSINQTLSRTILTSFTTWLAVLIMYIWGGPGFRGFNFAMIIGILVGTYSSIAIAAPILIIGKKTKSPENQNM